MLTEAKLRDGRPVFAGLDISSTIGGFVVALCALDDDGAASIVVRSIPAAGGRSIAAELARSVRGVNIVKALTDAWRIETLRIASQGISAVLPVSEPGQPAKIGAAAERFADLVKRGRVSGTQKGESIAGIMAFAAMENTAAGSIDIGSLIA